MYDISVYHISVYDISGYDISVYDVSLGILCARYLGEISSVCVGYLVYEMYTE